ncbi:Spo0E family sporulation regulatory protein-aspartic acid phosphatase [Pontibacillus yanchengensis]|uniref:Spo0E family sporulation regulatory protein-aspartic acid phosphatase n=2 Tax=Pontibacillus yanchengensis TaxID=462910 RepID=A0ACC7VIN9_9BACI|nr:aspartyl-phosphate phosphatase Spo0E family protein [Pontibacillus yanchengensis]MYL34951.1 Spo0E family sporulation regulatory protein-aspartic acid phosphatase [Pontibacillus yanchengensis]MYL55318.1 Spo0E family sporulation regulatory protein-aspartic acid phosphatase [Pontibacillus yanchengensis]
MCKDLLEEIESCRKKLVHLSNGRALSSREIVEVSAELDNLLNLYEQKRTKYRKQQLTV